MRAIVKYHNDINKINFSLFKEKEMDLLFCLLYKFKDLGTKEQTLDFHELKELSEHKRMDRFIEDLSKVYDKLLRTTYKLENDGIIEKFTIFNHYKLDTIERKATITINNTFQYLLNELIGNYTLLDLKEFISLKGSYPKTLFRLLKQWEATKKYIIKMQDFKDLMGIPENYKMFNIDQKILVPCLEQLGQHFKNLKVEKIKKGVKIDSLKFSWTEDISGLFVRNQEISVLNNNLENPETEKIPPEVLKFREKIKKQVNKLPQIKQYEFLARLIPLNTIESIEKLWSEYEILEKNPKGGENE